MNITIQTGGTEITAGRSGLYIETRALALHWPRGGRLLVSRKHAAAKPEALPEAA